MKFIEGQNRHQLMIPDSLDQHISENNPIRFIDAFVENLEIKSLGFKTERKNPKGRAAYHPASMLKLYIYGYLNKIRSSRDLERETYRNIELYWLINHLHPDHSSIARFRKNNWKAIRRTCREFTVVCKKLDMFDKELIAIDGSYFKASASKEKMLDRKALKKKLKSIDKQIEKYLQSMNSTDKAEKGNDLSKASLDEKIAALEHEKDLYREFEKQLEDPDEKKSPADPDARLLRKGGKSTLGYNVQSVVDSKHHLIVDHEVTTAGNDSGELADMSIKAKETLEAEEIKAVADSGYQNSLEVERCLENGITPFVPERVHKKGDFSRDKFSYCPDKDCYCCPEGFELHYYSQRKNKERIEKLYRTPACKDCRKKPECTKNKNGRIISRWVKEEILEEMRQRIEAHPEMLKKRKSMAEHPFGTIKQLMGSNHFLTRGMNNVKTEMSLHVLVYNLKRVLNVVSMDKLLAAVE